MRRFSGIGLAWIAATVVAVTIAAAAVGSVRSEVTNRPTALGIAVSPEITVAPAIEASQPSPEVLDVPQQQLAPTISSIPQAFANVPEVAGIAVTTTLLKPSHTTKTLPHGGSSTTTSTLRPPTTTQPAGSGTTPTGPGQTTSTTSPASTPPSTTSTTSTTLPSTTTTTTVDEPADRPYTREIATDAGSISLRVSGDDVNFRRGFARRGWSLEVVNAGPKLVKVVFENNNNANITITVDATIIAGEFISSIKTTG